jgi:hypothetical protein
VASVYSLVYDSHIKLAACAYRNKLYVFDPQKGELGAPAIEKLSSRPILGEPGTILYADGNTLFSYSLTTRESRELAKLPAKIGSIAYGGPEKKVFVACGVDVYSLQETPLSRAMSRSATKRRRSVATSSWKGRSLALSSTSV